MDYLPVHLYTSIKKLQDVRYFLIQRYDQRDLSMSKMTQLIEVTIKRIGDLNHISPNARELIDTLDPSDLVVLAKQLYNLQTYLCA